MAEPLRENVHDAEPYRVADKAATALKDEKSKLETLKNRLKAEEVD